jgi:hypothetical protein
MVVAMQVDYGARLQVMYMYMYGNVNHHHPRAVP